MGGILARAGQNRRLATAANLRLAALLGVALALLWLIVGSNVTTIAIQIENRHASPGQIAYCALALAAVAASWFTPRVVVASLALPAAALWMFWGQGGHLLTLQPAGLLILLPVLVRRRERLPRSWLWLAGGLFALLTVAAVYPVNGPLQPRLATLSIVTPLIALVVVIVWSTVDARPLIALTIYLASYMLPLYLVQAEQHQPITPVMLVPAVVTAVLATAGAWRLRRHAVL
jgi:hypothetical protein